MLNVPIPAREYFSIAGWPMTDAIAGALLCSAILFFYSLWMRRSFAPVPSRHQVVLELLHDLVYNKLKEAFENEADAKKFTPLFLTLALFLLVANQIINFPIIFEILFDHLPLFRQPTADLSGTLALALVVLGAANIIAFTISPLRYFYSYFPVNQLFQARSVKGATQAIINIGIGGMELISEFAKVISLACRLFGNMYAGNVVVLVILSIASYTHYFIPIPFLVLGIFAGLIQAYVFTLLTIQFLSTRIKHVQNHTPAH